MQSWVQLLQPGLRTLALTRRIFSARTPHSAPAGALAAELPGDLESVSAGAAEGHRNAPHMGGYAPVGHSDCWCAQSIISRSALAPYLAAIAFLVPAFLGCRGRHFLGHSVLGRPRPLQRSRDGHRLRGDIAQRAGVRVRTCAPPVPSKEAHGHGGGDEHGE